MFRASSCPSSEAYQLQQQPLIYRSNVVVAVLLAVDGPVVVKKQEVVVVMMIYSTLKSFWPFYIKTPLYWTVALYNL